jgi:hypothetical protein
VHLPLTLGYDRVPECLSEEKQALLADLLVRRGLLVFTTDPQIPMGQVVRDDKGRYGLEQKVAEVCALAD